MHSCINLHYIISSGFPYFKHHACFPWQMTNIAPACHLYMFLYLAHFMLEHILQFSCHKAEIAVMISEARGLLRLRNCWSWESEVGANVGWVGLFSWGASGVLMAHPEEQTRFKCPCNNWCQRKDSTKSTNQRVEVEDRGPHGGTGIRR